MFHIGSKFGLGWLLAETPDGVFWGLTGTSGQNASAAWEAYVNEKPEDNVFPRHMILEQMRDGAFEEQHGSVIRANIEWAQNPNVQWITELGTVTVFRPDTFDNCEYSWKFVACDVPMTDFERGITEGGAGKYDLEAEKLENMKGSVEDAINAQFFGDGTASGSLVVGGLQLICSTTPTTGTVGLINRATYSFFRNQANDATKTTNKYDNLVSTLTTSYNLCSNGVGSQNPDYIIGNLTNFGGYESTIQALERFVREDPGQKGIRGFKGQSLMFKDVPITYDPACPTGQMFVLNKRNLKFVYMQWMKADPNPVRPADGFWDVFKVLTIGNLITNNPRRLGVVYNTES